MQGNQIRKDPEKGKYGQIINDLSVIICQSTIHFNS